MTSKEAVRFMEGIKCVFTLRNTNQVCLNNKVKKIFFRKCKKRPERYLRAATPIPFLLSVPTTPLHDLVERPPQAGSSNHPDWVAGLSARCTLCSCVSLPVSLPLEADTSTVTLCSSCLARGPTGSIRVYWLNGYTCKSLPVM